MSIKASIFFVSATFFLAIALVSVGGCSDAEVTTASPAEQPFSEKELADMRKSVGSREEYQLLVKRKLAERQGSLIDRSKRSSSKKKSR